MERVEILDLMGQLKLAGMRAAYDEILDDGIRRQLPMPQVVGALLRAQIAAAHARSIAYQLGMAKFPMAKTLAQFDFGASPVNEALVRERHAGGFLDDQRNLVWSAAPAPAKRGDWQPLRAPGSACAVL